MRTKLFFYNPRRTWVQAYVRCPLSFKVVKLIEYLYYRTPRFYVLLFWPQLYVYVSTMSVIFLMWVVGRLAERGIGPLSLLLPTYPWRPLCKLGRNSIFKDMVVICCHSSYWKNNKKLRASVGYFPFRRIKCIPRISLECRYNLISSNLTMLSVFISSLSWPNLLWDFQVHLYVFLKVTEINLSK